jgi:DNA gyrase/topoisomerase IV subunit A
VRGRVARIETDPAELVNGLQLASISGSFASSPEPVRMLAAPANEELMLVFSSGRIVTLPVNDIPHLFDEANSGSQTGTAQINWEAVRMPVEPHGGETLACITRISQLALADHFIQASRRGYLKKIRIAMAESILQNRFIGAGVKKAPDRTFEVLLCKNEGRLVLISWEGNLVNLDVKNIPISIEEVIRLGATDHLRSAFVLLEAHSVLAVTNVGKTVHLSDERLAVTTSFKTHGMPIFSTRRKSQGVRVVGAVSASSGDWIITLDMTGALKASSVETLSGAGTLGEGVEPVALCLVSPNRNGR